MVRTFLMPVVSTRMLKPVTWPRSSPSDFESTSSDVNISVSRFTVEGEFLGLSSLDQSLPCAEKIGTRKPSQKLGASIRMECKVRIQELWGKYGDRMEFLEPFLSYRSGKKHTLYSIPVKILNMRRDGVKVNEVCD
jgi:hypothetical protein